MEAPEAGEYGYLVQIISTGLDLKEFEKSLPKELAQLSRDLEELEKTTLESLWKKRYRCS